MKILVSDNFKSLNINLNDFDTDIYHTYDWCEIDAEQQSGQTNFILISDNNNQAFLPLIKKNIDGFNNFYLTSAYGYSGVCFSKNCNKEFKNNIWLELQKFLEKEGCVSLFLRLHPILNVDVHNSIFSYGNGKTLSVDLKRDYSEIFSSYASGHKYDLKKLYRNNSVEVFEDVNLDYYDDFIRLYIETMRFVSASEFYYFSKMYFSSLKERLNDFLKLVIVKFDGKVIGASLFLCYNNIIQYHLSGSDSEYRIYQPSKLILDFVIKFGVSANYDYLHLGGGLGGNQDTLYKFKCGFSSDELDFYTLRMVCNNHIYEQLCYSKGWKKEDIMNISNFFPLYLKSNNLTL